MKDQEQLPQMELDTALDWFDEWETATADSRTQAEMDRDYYDGIQWTSEETEELQRRGQPIITINRIAPRINALLGDEIRKRVDPAAKPRTPQHEDGAPAVTDALRYVSDVENMQAITSKCYKHMLVEGFGGCVVDTEVVEEAVPLAQQQTPPIASVGQDVMTVEQSSIELLQKKQRVEIRLRGVAWDRLWYDPHSSEPDFSDAKYLGEVIWMDYEDALAKYPDSRDALESSKSGNDHQADDTTEDKPRAWYDNKRERVKIVCVYWREGDRWMWAHFTAGGWLIPPTESTYMDEDGKSECPLVLASSFVDRENNRYGVVRTMRSPQDEINKRRSKAMHILSVRQTIGEKGAVDDVDEAKRQMARPDGHIEINPGMRFEIAPTNDMAQAQFQLLQEAKGEIENVGPNMPTFGGNQGVMSGRAVLAMQEAGTLTLEPLFDNLRAWRKRVYEQIWHRVRQFWTEERWLRVRDEEGPQGYRFVAVNRKMTKGQRLQELVSKGAPIQPAIYQLFGPTGMMAFSQAMQQLSMQVQQGAMMAQQTGQPFQPPPPQVLEQQAVAMLMQTPEAQQPYTDNSIDKLGVDIVLDEAPDSAVIAGEQFAQLAELAKAGLPIPPDVLLEASQLRDKRKIIERVQAASRPDPQQAAMMQKQQADLHQMTMAQGQARVMKDQAEAQWKSAQTQGVMPEAEKDKAQAIKAMAEAQKAGLEARGGIVPTSYGL